MIKHKILSSCEDDWDTDAILNATKNKLLIESIYDEVFRKHIKYGTAKKEIEMYETVWKEVYAYLNQED